MEFALTKKRTALVPQYLRQFSCIGSECEDSCCVGWKVEIDEQTYKSYNNVRHTELTPLLKKKVTRNRSNPTNRTYAKIKMEPNGACPFLSQEKLCNIQQKLGESYLSSTCSTYPRISNEVNGVLERSATVSCPEIARLALLNEQGIEFDEVSENVDERTIISKSLNTLGENSRKIEKYFWELRIFTIQVLQNREYSLAERLIFLGMFFQKLEEYVTNQQFNDIPRLIASYSAMFSDNSLRSTLENIPHQQSIQMALLKEVSDQRFLFSVTSMRYINCYKKMLQGLNFSGDMAMEEIAKNYIAAYEEHYKPFMDDHEYILENYLVNHVYKNMFPLSGFPTLFDNYVMLVIHYSMIKMHLIGIAAFDKELTKDSVIVLLQSFSKTVEHSSLFLKRVYDLLKECGYTSMAYMAILIKN